MSSHLPTVHLVRHGETEWSRSGRHTGRTDVPLTERGEAEALALGKQLAGLAVAQVFSNPLQRARRTCELAGFGDRVVIDPDLSEWDYGEYEGRLTTEIRQQRADWQLFRDGCPGGESVEQISARADRALQRLRGAGGDVLVFASGHLLRVLAARWLGLDAACGRLLVLGTASISILGYEHTIDEPALLLWNQCHK